MVSFSAGVSFSEPKEVSCHERGCDSSRRSGDGRKRRPSLRSTGVEDLGTPRRGKILRRVWAADLADGSRVRGGRGGHPSPPPPALSQILEGVCAAQAAVTGLPLVTRPTTIRPNSHDR